MYNIEELKLRLLSELKEIAENLGVKNFKKLNKQDLIYAILDQQAITPEEKLPKKEKEEAQEEAPKQEEKSSKPKPRKKTSDEKPKGRPRRENVTETPEAKSEKPKSADDKKGQDKEQPKKAKSDDQNGDRNQDRGQDRKDNRRSKKQEYNQNIKDFDGLIENEGVLEMMQDGYGFLR